MMRQPEAELSDRSHPDADFIAAPKDQLWRCSDPQNVVRCESQA